MKVFLLIVILIFPAFASAQMYKCKPSNGVIAFSDGSCSKNTSQEKVQESPKEPDWIGRLQKEKPATITINEVVHDDDDVIIKYEFKTKSESNRFIKLASKVSNMPVILMKYTAPKSGILGRAELKVSNKPNPLLKKTKQK